jgi:hypothetical protein
MPLRKCIHCGVEAHTEQELDLFQKAKTGKYGRGTRCKPCQRQMNRALYAKDPQKKQKQNMEWRRLNQERYNKSVSDWSKNNRAARNATIASRRAKKLCATPAWFDAEEVRYIYALAKERGLHVDHIVPLKHPLVCGLHVQDNLRCIPKELNLWKSNKLLKGVRDV